MAYTIAFFCASALLVQAVFGQSVGPGSWVSGNSVVENDIYIGSGYGAGWASGANMAGGPVLASGAGLVGGPVLANGAALVGGPVLASGAGLAGYGLGAGSVGYSGASAGSSGVVVGGSNRVAVSPLLVTAISPIGPSGLAVASENVIEANLRVTGQLPFLSAVAFEGALPTAGSGVATCGCGNGAVGITSEGVGRPGIWY